LRAGYQPVYDDIGFVRKTEEIALNCGYKPIELCWMTWLIQPEGKKDEDENIFRYSFKDLAVTSCGAYFL